MKRLVIYLIVTFGLTWGLLIPAGFALGTYQDGEASSMVMIGLIALSMFFPLVGALVANAASKPDERINLGWKPLIGKNIPSYLIAWFAPAGIALLGCAVFFVANPQSFDPTMASYIESTAAAAGVSADELMASQPPTPILLSAILLASLTIAPFINMIPAVGEEVGWRAMLFPTLLELIPERAAVLVSGIIWGLWHAPVIAMGHNYGMGYAGFPLAGICTMTLACTALGCLMCLLRVRTGSVWPCALAHGAFNAVANIGVVFCIGGASLFGPSPLALVAGIPLFAVGVYCWLQFKRA